MDIKKACRGAMAALRTTRRDLRQSTLKLLNLKAKYDTLASKDPILAHYVDEVERLQNLNDNLEREANRLLDEIQYHERTASALRNHINEVQNQAGRYKAWALACTAGFLAQGVSVTAYLIWLG